MCVTQSTDTFYQYRIWRRPLCVSCSSSFPMSIVTLITITCVMYEKMAPCCHASSQLLAWCLLSCCDIKPWQKETWGRTGLLCLQVTVHHKGKREGGGTWKWQLKQRPWENILRTYLQTSLMEEFSQLSFLFPRWPSLCLTLTKKQANEQTLPSTHGYLAAKEISVGKVGHIRTCHRQQKTALLRLALTQKQGRLLWSLKSSAARSKKRN